MDDNKRKIAIYLVVILFGTLGIYLTFFASNTSKYDSKIRAYRIIVEESYDSDDNIIYKPIYYFKVNGKEYECNTKTGSSTYPNEKKNTVYYDSSNPTKCMTENEKSTSKFGGIIFLIFTVLIIYFGIIKKTSNSTNNIEPQIQPNPEFIQNINNTVGKIQLIYKRIILGIIITILLVLILLDTMILKQTIKANDYVETTATYVTKKDDGDSSTFCDYIYTFKDKQGTEQEVIISDTVDSTPKNEIKVKYNENNPKEHYVEGATFDKTGIIWYIVKIIVLISLIGLFLNKNLLNKINISTSSNRG